MELSKEELKLQDHYNQLAEAGDHTVTAKDHFLRDLEIDYCLPLIPAGADILDIGCGPAYSLSRYVQEADVNHAEGIDYSTQMVSFAKELIREKGLESKVNIQKGSAFELPYQDNIFDVVTTHRVLIVLLSWDHQKKAIEEAFRVLKPGGLFLMTECTFERKEYGMYYFISRIIQPLFVHPEAPSYTHKLNEIGRKVAGVYPEFNNASHLTTYVTEKI